MTNTTTTNTNTTATTAKKITKREKFQMLLEIPAVNENDLLVKFIEHELELLSKKNGSGEKKLTATQLANESIKEAILESMEDNRLYTVGEMIKEFSACVDLSAPKVTALVTQLKDKGLLERIEEKRRAYYRKIQ